MPSAQGNGAAGPSWTVCTSAVLGSSGVEYRITNTNIFQTKGLKHSAEGEYINIWDAFGREFVSTLNNDFSVSNRTVKKEGNLNACYAFSSKEAAEGKLRLWKGETRRKMGFDMVAMTIAPPGGAAAVVAEPATRPAKNYALTVRQPDEPAKPVAKPAARPAPKPAAKPGPRKPAPPQKPCKKVNGSSCVTRQ